MINLNTSTKLRIARILSSAVKMSFGLSGASRNETICKRGGIQWALDLDEGIQLAIYLGNIFEKGAARSIANYLKPGMVVLDIGANIGAHALPMSKRVGPSGKVYAFEPTAKAFKRLKQNLKLNSDLDLICTPMQIAVVDHESPKPAAFYSSWALEPSQGDHPVHGGKLNSTEGAEFITLDDWAQREGLKRVDFIKIDVDGFECKVLRGAEKTLTTHKPGIIIELCNYTQQENGDSLSEVVHLLKKYGYDLHSENMKSPLPMEANALNRFIPIGGSINAFALPRVSGQVGGIG